MVEQTHSLVSPLEQMVWQIQVRVVEEVQQLPFSHQTLVASSVWVEMAVQGWL
jgi:hypothetical protein